MVGRKWEPPAVARLEGVGGGEVVEMEEEVRAEM